jgi:signal transduction histidine kinase
MVAELRSTQADTPRAFLLTSIFAAYKKFNLDSARYYNQIGLDLANRMHWKKAQGVFHANKGQVFSGMAKYDSALLEFDTAMTFYAQIRDSTNEASTLNDIGVAYMDQSRNKEAAPYFFRSVALSEPRHKDNLAAAAYSNISLIYSGQEDYPKAVQYMHRSMALSAKIDDMAGVGSGLTGLANIALLQKDTAAAKMYYDSSIAILQKTGDEFSLAQALSNVALLHGRNLDQQIKGLIRAQAIWNRISPLHKMSIINTGNIGVAFLDIIRVDTLHKVPRGGLVPLKDKDILRLADYYLKKAISMSRQVKDTGNAAYFTGVLAEADALRGDYKNAYLNFREYQGAMDSVFSQDAKNKLASLEEQHEVSLRDKEIQIGKLALLAEKRRRLAMSVGLCLLGVIGVLLYFQNRARLKTNTKLRKLNTELAAAEKVKAKFFAILSHDLRSPITNFINFLHLQREKPNLLDAQKTAAHQQKIADYAEGLLGTMESMLLWSKGQMEEFTPESREVPVRELFRHLEIFFAGQEDTLRFSEPGELSLTTDDNYLKAILHNLTANALRAVQRTPGGQVSWRAYTGDRGLVLEIRDNGPGMSAEQLRSLEEDRPVSHASRGFGLHIVRDLARAIRCTITVHSQLGEGTRFTLEFPV